MIYERVVETIRNCFSKFHEVLFIQWKRQNVIDLSQRDFSGSIVAQGSKYTVGTQSSQRGSGTIPSGYPFNHAAGGSGTFIGDPGIGSHHHRGWGLYKFETSVFDVTQVHQDER